MSAICHYGHEVPGVSSKHSFSCYVDANHGIVKPIWICDECLLAHVRKYYPGCPIERALVALRPELAEKEYRQEKLLDA